MGKIREAGWVRERNDSRRDWLGKGEQKGEAGWSPSKVPGY